VARSGNSRKSDSYCSSNTKFCAAARSATVFPSCPSRELPIASVTKTHVSIPSSFRMRVRLPDHPTKAHHKIDSSVVVFIRPFHLPIRGTSHVIPNGVRAVRNLSFLGCSDGPTPSWFPPKTHQISLISSRFLANSPLTRYTHCFVNHLRITATDAAEPRLHRTHGLASRQKTH
jgi:hypothetical protein